MAITIKEIYVRTSIVKTEKEFPLSPDTIRRIKEEILREILDEHPNPHPYKRER